MEEWRCEDTDLAAFAREGPEVKTRGRLSANSAELIHLQQKDAICGYARDLRTFRMCPTIAPDFRTMSANHERILDPGLMHALETRDQYGTTRSTVIGIAVIYVGSFYFSTKHHYEIVIKKERENYV